MSEGDSKPLLDLAPSKKAKKSSNFAIYDALKAAQTSRPLAAPALLSAKGLHSNAARWNEILMPKTFLMKKKRKKKLTTFKKKILMVCVRFLELHYSLSNAFNNIAFSFTLGKTTSEYQKAC